MTLTRKQQRTQQEILESFHALLEHHPFDQITITMICEEALIHHSTFYRYFDDKYSLLQAFIATTFICDPKQLSDSLDLASTISERLTANWNVFENLTRYNQSHEIYFDLIQLFSKLFQDAVAANPDTQEPVLQMIIQSPHPDYAVYGVAGSIVGTFIKWNDNPSSVSKEELTTLLRDVMLDYQHHVH